ncbi:MAG: urease subunit beta [Ktedonobacterales bacterium]
MLPGTYLLADGDIEANNGRATAQVVVRHTGDRPIQVGSHYHFFEVNRELAFERRVAYGMRLNIPAGTAVRFEPGDEKVVSLVAFAGGRRIYGHNGLVNGWLDDPSLHAVALQRLTERGFAGTPLAPALDGQATSGMAEAKEEGKNI